MAETTKKVPISGLKKQLKETKKNLEETVLKYDAIRMYIGHYQLGEHFLLWVNAHKEKTDLPPKLIVKDGKS